MLIFEDEIPAYEKLLGFIESAIPDAKILGWGRSVAEAKYFLDKHKDVELIFSDIELLDGNSFEVYESIKINCPIIFCTAFDQYLFKAFQTNGIAYILKPYTLENFNEAIEKYKSLFAQNDAEVDQGVMSQLKQMLQQNDQHYKRRFSIKKKDGIKLLSVENIVCIQANGDFSFAFDDKGDKHVINSSLGSIESKLNPNYFFRINRSEILNIDKIQKIEPYFKNRLAIVMQKFETTLYTSSAKTKDFRAWLEK